MNTFGHLYRLTSFGESHGLAMGGVVDGMPAGVAIDLAQLQQFVARRRPNARHEGDEVQVLSGLYQGKTLGTPIGFVVPNTDAHSQDYATLEHLYRPNHADLTYQLKYGHRDPRGGGRASARETVARVVAGGLALQVLNLLGITITATASYVGGSSDHHDDGQPETYGGIVACRIEGVPVGLGEPVAGKLHAELAAAMMSIPAAHGFDYGLGWDFAFSRGSAVLDTFVPRPDGTIGTATNHSGGVQGGISNGQPITLRVAFKPVATIVGREIATVDDCGQPTTFVPQGRHDIQVVQRALPIVEAMAAMVILDHYLLNRTARL